MIQRYSVFSFVVFHPLMSARKKHGSVNESTFVKFFTVLGAQKDYTGILQKSYTYVVIRFEYCMLTSASTFLLLSNWIFSISLARGPLKNSSLLLRFMVTLGVVRQFLRPKAELFPSKEKEEQCM